MGDHVKRLAEIEVDDVYCSLSISTEQMHMQWERRTLMDIQREKHVLTYADRGICVCMHTEGDTEGDTHAHTEKGEALMHSHRGTHAQTQMEMLTHTH